MKVFYSQKYGCNFFENNRMREEARKNLISFSEIKKSPFSTNTMDYSEEDGISIYYDTSNYIKEIELFEPNGCFLIGDVNIVGKSADYLINILDLNNLKYIINEDHDGMSIADNTIRFFIPNLDEDGNNAKVEAVLIKVKDLK